MFLDSEMVANTKNVLAEDKYNKINVESPLFLCFVFSRQFSIFKCYYVFGIYDNPTKVKPNCINNYL